MNVLFFENGYVCFTIEYLSNGMENDHFQISRYNLYYCKKDQNVTNFKVFGLKITSKKFFNDFC